ncbi:4-phosphoerythronate dehydrogenase [Striga asiatica]|uniref:4-phosphoerythronate dehydrogenase n=1 Tax=Striga asiatica TaxID=4170 RepID=A0A5A7QN43_STRAF|nr:4-phosphoerythronate dehydrogenase [Striga asiatica]
MNKLAFPEPLKPEYLAVRLERRRLHVGDLRPCPDYVSGDVLGQVLVERVPDELQVLGGLSEPERVEPLVHDERPVEIFWRLGAGIPQRPVGDDGLRGGALGGRFLPTESESGLDSGRSVSDERRRGDSHGGGWCFQVGRTEKVAAGAVGLGRGVDPTVMGSAGQPGLICILILSCGDC